MKNETWKPVVGYKKYYHASSRGRIKSLKRNVITSNGKRYPVKEKIKKQCIGNNGYYYVGLCKNGKTKNFTVHGLISKAFFGKPKKGLEVNHIDGNKLNNNIENLEYVTRSENIQHAYDKFLIKK